MPHVALALALLIVLWFVASIVGPGVTGPARLRPLKERIAWLAAHAEAGEVALGVTAKDVEAARQHVEQLRDRHATAIAAAHEKLAEMRQANGGQALPADKAGEVQGIFADADKLGLDLDAANNAYQDLQQRAFGRSDDDRMSAETAQRRGHSPAAISSASLASRLIESEQWERAREAAKRAPDGTQAQVMMRELVGAVLSDSAETAALLSMHAAVRGGVPAAQLNGFEPLVPEDISRRRSVQELAARPTTLLDLITISTTESDVVDYTVQTGETINVAGVPVGPEIAPDAVPIARYLPLPESDLAVERRSMPVVDRGTVLTVPERNLEDEGRVRSFIDGRLTRGLQRDTESEVLAGPGGGDHMLGLMNWPGIAEIEAIAGDPVAVSIYRGITRVRMTAFREPTAIAYRPDTLAGIVTERDANGRYVNTAGPLSPFGQTIWGFPGVVAHVLSVQPGDPLAIVGVWDELELVLRSGVTIREFNQHADYARRRLVLIRALYRAAALVNDPNAFAIVDLTPPAPAV